MSQSLIDTLIEEDCPCDDCSAFIYKLCARSEMACDQFKHYVETGEIDLSLDKKPTKKIFTEIQIEEVF
jgi:hypothetical protein|tara:strand:- start:336 stop:542 length:207 start_codon:yes stop_codon:yes gene_type:complete